MRELQPEEHPMKPLDTLDSLMRMNHDELIDLLDHHRDNPPYTVPLARIFELYDSLPSPKVCYLERNDLRRLIKIISRQNTKINAIAQQYAAVIKDMQANNTTIRYSEWSGLIDALGKGFLYKRKEGSSLARQALLDMEHTGIKPSDVVLNQLLQAATRANDFELARTINAEFRSRNLPTSIITWTERIKEAGQQKDVSRIHMTFRDFCQTGITVDIVFVNALLEAFLTANQATFAELIYLRLRGLAMTQFKKGQAPRTNDFVAIRRQRATLNDATPKVRQVDHEIQRRRLASYRDGQPDHSHLRDQLLHTLMLPTNADSSLVPNHGTLRLFLTYHCHYTGRFEDIAFYLNEMDGFGVQPNYGTYVDLLHGFFRWHVKYPQWDAERLEKLFTFIVNENGRPMVPITYVVALTGIRAFGTVQGGQKAREVWETLRPWLQINSNVQDKRDAKVDQLEQVVQKFEKGEDLGYEMSGGDPRWRIIDWRTCS